MKYLSYFYFYSSNKKILIKLMIGHIIRKRKTVPSKYFKILHIIKNKNNVEFIMQTHTYDIISLPNIFKNILTYTKCGFLANKKRR